MGTVVANQAPVVTVELKAAAVQNLLSFLSNDQVAALERKAASLEPEIQESMRQDFPDMPPAVQYMLRRSAKEANSFLASKLRPIWVGNLSLHVPALVSKDDSSRKEAERACGKIIDTFPDIKETVKVLVAVKLRLYRATTNPLAVSQAIEQVCKIARIKPETLN